MLNIFPTINIGLKNTYWTATKKVLSIAPTNPETNSPTPPFQSFTNESVEVSHISHLFQWRGSWLW